MRIQNFKHQESQSKLCKSPKKVQRKYIKSPAYVTLQFNPPDCCMMLHVQSTAESLHPYPHRPKQGRCHLPRSRQMPFQMHEQTLPELTLVSHGFPGSRRVRQQSVSFHAQTKRLSASLMHNIIATYSDQMRPHHTNNRRQNQISLVTLCGTCGTKLLQVACLSCCWISPARDMGGPSWVPNMF